MRPGHLWIAQEVATPRMKPFSLLYTIESIMLTPHIAGSSDEVCRRMGRIVVEEVGRFVRGEPLRWALSHEQAAIMA
jgi:phosphoglycerate dehydrogenase-like enzyme